MSAWGSVRIIVSGSLFIFITVDNLVQVAINTGRCAPCRVDKVSTRALAHLLALNPAAQS